MEKKTQEELLLTDEEKDEICCKVGVPWKDQWLGVQKIVNESIRAQLSKVLKAGYLSPEEAKKQGIVDWLISHKETYWQKPDGTIYLITRACWTEEDWQALTQLV